MISKRSDHQIYLVVAPCRLSNPSDYEINTRFKSFCTSLFGSQIVPVQMQSCCPMGPYDSHYGPVTVVEMLLDPKSNYTMRDASSQLFERIFSPNSLSCFRSITDKSLIGLSIPSDSLDTMYVQWYDEMFKSTALNRCSIIGTIDSAYRKRAYLPEWALTISVMMACRMTYDVWSANMGHMHKTCVEGANRIVEKRNACAHMTSKDRKACVEELRKNINDAITDLRLLVNSITTPSSRPNNDGPGMEHLRLKCYKAAVGTCKLIMDMDEGSLAELVRCRDRAFDAAESSEAPSSQAAQTVFDEVYDTEFHPLSGLGNTFSQPIFWPAVPIAIPFVIVGTVLGGPYALTRESIRRNRIWKMYQLSSFIDAMFRLLSELHRVLGVESVNETSLTAKELSLAGSIFPDDINDELTTKAVTLEKWSEKIMEDPVQFDDVFFHAVGLV